MIFRRRRYAKVNQQRLHRVQEVQETPMPTPTRRFVPARVELTPSHELVTYVRGGPCTTAKVFRPGDSGPMLSIYHIPVDPGVWDRLTDTSIRLIAREMKVEETDLRKAVDELCHGRR